MNRDDAAGSASGHDTRHIALLVGSLRKVSPSRTIASVLDELAPGSLRLEPVEISRLGLYRPERDREPPPEWILFRRQIQAADGVLIVAAEFTQTVPAVIRNAIEIASHPDDCNAWRGKPAAVVGMTPAGRTRFRICQRLQKRLAGLDAPVMPQPRTAAAQVLDVPELAQHAISRSTLHYLGEFVHAFDDWVHVNCRH